MCNLKVSVSDPFDLLLNFLFNAAVVAREVQQGSLVYLFQIWEFLSQTHISSPLQQFGLRKDLIYVQTSLFLVTVEKKTRINCNVLITFDFLLLAAFCFVFAHICKGI